MLELEPANAVADLRRRGIVPPAVQATVRPLSGGISNTVLRVEWPGGCVVVKQSLARLRVSAEWPFDRARTLIERDCLEAIGELEPGAAPSVLFCDEEAFLLGMTCAPTGGEVWKDALLRGEVDGDTVGRAARLIGRLHARAARSPGLRERFADQMPLLQGRIDPYHRTAAAAHPELAATIDAEVERMLATRRTLVLGDYAPKNLIAYPDRVLALDFEVAHWGDPAFDVAFMLTHLILKACARPRDAALYLAAARSFWAAYGPAAGTAGAAEADVVAELGCLLLARIDGKSPVEYLTRPAQHAAVRALAAHTLHGRRELETVLAQAAECEAAIA